MRTRSALLLAAALCGCGPSGVQLDVDVVTDVAPITEFATVQTDVIRADGSVAAMHTAPAAATGSYVHGLRVAELSGIALGEYTIRVALLDARGAVLVKRDTLVRLAASYALTVVMTRSCRDVTCPATGGDLRLTECAGGRCVDPRCRPDDPASCPTPACTMDAQCTPAVSCAVGHCISGECLFADEGACGPMRWCDPSHGCMDRPTPVDAGPLDAGPTDGGATCVPHTCAELGLECGTLVQCGMPPVTCPPGCTLPATCGGGGAANHCGHGDITPPTVVITSGPPSPTTADPSTFTFTADDGPGVGVDHIECRLDGAAFAPCTSPFSRSGVPEGMHSFDVRAVDLAMNTSAPVSWPWTIDRSMPSLVIAAIADPAPSGYTDTPAVSFSYTCTDSLSACDFASVSCTVDGASIPCGPSGGSVMVGYSGPFAFGAHTLAVQVADAAGNTATASQPFTVSRCANDMQFPTRTSNGLTRGGCCAGLVPSNWMDFSFGFWHPRGDASCRPMSDFDSLLYETIWGGGSCVGSMTTQAWLQGMSLPGCATASGRSACVDTQLAAQQYCGTDGGSGTQTPLHGRAGEGWHPAGAAGCSSGTISNSLLMQRYGTDDTCFTTVDQAGLRGSVTATDVCKSPGVRFCRTNPVDSAVACVCATADPYTSDGRN